MTQRAHGQVPVRFECDADGVRIVQIPPPRTPKQRQEAAKATDTWHFSVKHRNGLPALLCCWCGKETTFGPKNIEAFSEEHADCVEQQVEVSA
jgi:hypothetical protein